MAAPPTRKRQLGMSMERSLPKYQFWVMFSVLSTRQFWLGYTCASTRDQQRGQSLQQPEESTASDSMSH